MLAGMHCGRTLSSPQPTLERPELARRWTMCLRGTLAEAANELGISSEVVIGNGCARSSLGGDVAGGRI